MQILVKTLEGKTITVELGKFDKLEDVKAKIWQKTGTSVDGLRLIFGGRQIEEEGLIVDQMKLFNCGDRFETELTHPTLIVTSNLIGGANVTFHAPRVLELENSPLLNPDDDMKNAILQHEELKFLSCNTTTSTRRVNNQMNHSNSSSLMKTQIFVRTITRTSCWKLRENLNFLHIKHQELVPSLELNKEIQFSLQLSNKTDKYVAFKFKTTDRKKYCVRPKYEVVKPYCTCDVLVKMQVQKEAPTGVNCEDRFFLRSIVVNTGATRNDIKSKMFQKASGNETEEYKFRIVYRPSTQPLSPALGEEEELISEFIKEGKFAEARALVSKLVEEKDSAVERANKLRFELESSRHEGKCCLLILKDRVKEMIGKD